MSTGKLYLFPSLMAPCEPGDVLPRRNLELLVQTRYFVVEELRSARRFLKACDRSIDIDSLHFSVLNEHTPAGEVDAMLAPVFEGHDVGVISDYADTLELSFIDYSMDEPPKYDVEECKARDVNYAAPLKVRVRLRNKKTDVIKEQEIFMGDFPLMTKSGTFIVNGAERVVVSQIVRSPGVYYGKETDVKTDLPILTSQIIPQRGAWLEYETDSNDVFYVRVDRTRKVPITVLVRALGVGTNDEILELFGDEPKILASFTKDTADNYQEGLKELYSKIRPGEPFSLDSA